MSLKDIFQNETNKQLNNIRIKVIVNRKENIIVGDTSMVAIFQQQTAHMRTWLREVAI